MISYEMFEYHDNDYKEIDYNIPDNFQIKKLKDYVSEITHHDTEICDMMIKHWISGLKLKNFRKYMILIMTLIKNFLIF